MAVDTKSLIEDALRPLTGLPLAIAREAGGMQVLHFGRVRPHHSGRGTVGDYALHIQCSWRLVDGDGIITGLSDRFAGVDGDAEPDQDDWRGGNLQRIRLGAFMGGVDEATRSHVDPAGRHVVVAVEADRFGSADIVFGGGVRLQIFADGSREEDWRLCPVDADHFVISGGRVDVE